MTAADDTFAAYIECALWASTNEGGEPLDGLYSRDDFAEETLQTMRADIDDFLSLLEREHIDISDIAPEQLGHDFWLTRNHHGAGFWDRGLGDLGKRLTDLSHPYGGAYIYPGDDGRLYIA